MGRDAHISPPATDREIEDDITAFCVPEDGPVEDNEGGTKDKFFTESQTNRRGHSSRGTSGVNVNFSELNNDTTPKHR